MKNGHANLSYHPTYFNVFDSKNMYVLQPTDNYCKNSSVAAHQSLFKNKILKFVEAEAKAISLFVFELAFPL